MLRRRWKMELNSIIATCSKSGEPRGCQTVRLAGGTDAWCEITLSAKHGAVALTSGFIAVYRRKGRGIAEMFEVACLEVDDKMFGALLATTVHTAAERVCGMLGEEAKIGEEVGE